MLKKKWLKKVLSVRMPYRSERDKERWLQHIYMFGSVCDIEVTDITKKKPSC